MNRLFLEQSPYLLQHADNPVDWYPFGSEAFEAARALDRPLFISIGYSSCHWCHVMAHESFEDEAIAALLNEHFVSIKVDREERPDVDALYVEAAQALTGSAGWPLSVFCYPDGRPFYVGTYFPPVPRGNIASFSDVLRAVVLAWEEQRNELDDQAQRLTEVVEKRLEPAREASLEGVSALELLDVAVERFVSLFDPLYGGIGTAPKFPQPPMLELLLFAHATGNTQALEPVHTTLSQMARGGLYDQLGGGFARYSVDRAWLVPHFEKMLYDQALLARTYLYAFSLTGDEALFEVAEATIAYVLSDLSSNEGALYSAEDADSQGEEGRFYTWTEQELRDVLGDERGERAARYFGVSPEGNFEHGRSVLHLGSGAIAYDGLEKDRAALLAARSTRVRPGRDEKVLTEWNAMMASVLAEAALYFDRPDWGEWALRIGEFLLRHLRDERGRWRRSYRNGVASHLATLSDYAWLCELFCRLYELSGRAVWLGEARRAGDELIELFSSNDGGFFLSGADAEALVVRPRDLYDGVTPSASSMAVSCLQRLGELTGERSYLDRAAAAAACFAPALATAPLALAHLLLSRCVAELGTICVVVVGEHPELLGALRGRYLPGAVVAWGEPGATTLFDGRMEANCYVCRGGTCALPVASFAGVGALLDELTRI